MASAVDIRDATHADCAAVAELLAQLGYPVPQSELPGRLDRFREQGNGHVLVAAAAEQVLAFAAFEITYPIHNEDPVAHLTAIAVAQAARRQGIGRRLLLAVESAARAAGCDHVVVTSAEQRSDAHAFYPSAGWMATGRRFGKNLG
jgi:ribosomal protein S18 acetylase RimI-like enzyme